MPVSNHLLFTLAGSFRISSFLYKILLFVSLVISVWIEVWKKLLIFACLALSSFVYFDRLLVVQTSNFFTSSTNSGSVAWFSGVFVFFYFFLFNRSCGELLDANSSESTSDSLSFFVPARMLARVCLDVLDCLILGTSVLRACFDSVS